MPAWKKPEMSAEKEDVYEVVFELVDGECGGLGEEEKMWLALADADSNMIVSGYPDGQDVTPHSSAKASIQGSYTSTNHQLIDRWIIMHFAFRTTYSTRYRGENSTFPLLRYQRLHALHARVPTTSPVASMIINALGDGHASFFHSRRDGSKSPPTRVFSGLIESLSSLRPTVQQTRCGEDGGSWQDCKTFGLMGSCVYGLSMGLANRFNQRFSPLPDSQVLSCCQEPLKEASTFDIISMHGVISQLLRCTLYVPATPRLPPTIARGILPPKHTISVPFCDLVAALSKLFCSRLNCMFEGWPILGLSGQMLSLRRVQGVKRLANNRQSMNCGPHTTGWYLDDVPHALSIKTERRSLSHAKPFVKHVSCPEASLDSASEPAAIPSTCPQPACLARNDRHSLNSTTTNLEAINFRVSRDHSQLYSERQSNSFLFGAQNNRNLTLSLAWRHRTGGKMTKSPDDKKLGNNPDLSRHEVVGKLMSRFKRQQLRVPKVQNTKHAPRDARTMEEACIEALRLTNGTLLSSHRQGQCKDQGWAGLKTAESHPLTQARLTATQPKIQRHLYQVRFSPRILVNSRPAASLSDDCARPH
ncbi:hypothetical protein ACRALDRAFT_1090850 [Sodiomyces alcalophilus JCM 7366]|uniref:uncharacterized protein n=1 Tax=Sodiomyces alcalophilus JCM 7366 TaxID=591952 RepID=UPI0039B3FC79